MAIYFPIKMEQDLILKVADFIFQNPPPKQKERKKEERTILFYLKPFGVHYG